jgi:glyoxylase-like metal-dependent hydrolase (beta-lactamase superfamily II)
MYVERLVVGEFQANCFILLGEEKRAIIIDPGADADAIARSVDNHKAKVCLYILTHGHYDHASAIADAHALMRAPFAIHPDDLVWTFSNLNEMRPFYRAPEQPSNDVRKIDGDTEWQDAGLKYRVIHTPGHTPGSVCLYFPGEKSVFTGDTLFASSVGRTDLPGGDPRKLKSSLAKLAKLPDDTRVYPGHGPDTTILHEKRVNYFMQHGAVIS